MVKLLENTFRMINIGLVNEMAVMCGRMGIDIWEVIDAAATKPFGFMPFYPGPGLGGHCIPIDPFYLSWKSKQFGVEARFIELAGYVNSHMPHHVADKVMLALNDRGKALKGSRVHLLGVAYKKDIDDVRESPALDVAHLLRERGALLTFSDPFVSTMRIDPDELQAVDTLTGVAQSDCVVVITNHSQFPYPSILEKAKLVVDTRNAFKGYKSDKLVRL
jgi:UDP-N-acetyl-D-glucosamine dehydrogenase